MFGAGKKHHVGEGRDHGEQVDDGEGEEHGMEECVDLRATRAGIDKLSLLP